METKHLIEEITAETTRGDGQTKQQHKYNKLSKSV